MTTPPQKLTRERTNRATQRGDGRVTSANSSGELEMAMKSETRVWTSTASRSLQLDHLRPTRVGETYQTSCLSSRISIADDRDCLRYGGYRVRGRRSHFRAGNSRRYAMLVYSTRCQTAVDLIRLCILGRGQPPTRRYPMRNVKPPVRILNVS
ncbi:PREDICTED: uncharacterized protein LOC105563585 isoform X2 [Vollenhovia emeryi]|uniref:uncharacterized protein LOC105563585 isoform X2 n=1 Tax=Vollenhovia emeryi TaxID=411798 RepID=UPI0005F475B7|nr:PREDICTED: uncharacterized protein LOC105563585 isoform X2 [Vollenhovia emeryi]